MKILFVTGGDYSAMDIENGIGIKEAAKIAEANGGHYYYEDDEDYAELKIYEFGDVDEEFIGFIRNNFIDYDQSKATDFFIID